MLVASFPQHWTELIVLQRFSPCFMKKLLLLVIASICAFSALAQNQTLRVDYIFSGTDKTSEISLWEMACYDGWAGRKCNMDSVAVRGNGQIYMTDEASGKIIYRNSFSTLFQEWQTTEEATRVRKAFENVFLLPMPSGRTVVTVELYDFKGALSASFSHPVDPEDVLISRIPPQSDPHRYIINNGSPEDKIDVAIVAEGYSSTDMDLFYEDAEKAVNAILSHRPFSDLADRFNFVAVAIASKDSGVSVPGQGVWKNTAVGSHFNTFYMDRYLTTSHIFDLHDKLSGIPYEHIVILANTDTYGGGGIFNSYTLTTAHHKAFEPVVVHEFGHSFAGLADEYYYDDQFVEYYYPDCEPWERNISTLFDFESKWNDMLPRFVSIPTESHGIDVWEEIRNGADEDNFIGVYEGAGYQSRGVYRAYPDCRMKTNAAEGFCPVCRRAIEQMIEFYTD